MEFRLSRFINLVRRYFLLSKKLLLYGVTSLFILCGLFMWMVSDEGEPFVPDEGGEIVYVFLLIVCGFFFVASIFRSYRSHPERIQYLSLPASHFEKYLSKWMYTLPGYIGLSFLIFSIGYVVFSYLIEQAFGAIFIPYSELDFKNMAIFLIVFLVLHGFTFLFSTMVNRYPIPKIIIYGAGLFCISAYLAGIVFRIVFWDHFSGLYQPSENMGLYKLDIDFKNRMELFFEDKLIFIALAIVPFLWFVSYLKIKEKEA